MKLFLKVIKNRLSLFFNCKFCLSVSELNIIMEDKHQNDKTESRNKRKLLDSTQSPEAPNPHTDKNKRLKKCLLKKHQRPGYGDEKYSETEYYFENGLRKVYPYYYTFSTYCKGRWLNKTLLEVFTSDFLAQPPSEFERNIKNGNITVNGQIVQPDYVLRNSDYVENKIHRHEVPVVDQQIKIVHSSDELFVVDKPSSVPVHPCGRFRNNSLTFILGKEYGYKDLRSAYRLDRLTSGLMIFSRTLAVDQKLKEQMRDRKVEKQYVCRVEGVFPEEEIVCDEPIEIFSRRLGISRVDPNGKESKTIFRRLNTNGKSSVVVCEPKTGRTHQIRVHLQYLGYPIVNDPLYNNLAFGPEKGKLGKFDKSEPELVHDLRKDNESYQWFIFENESSGNNGMGLEKLLPSQDNQEEVLETPKDMTSDKYYDSNCSICQGKYLIRDPPPHQLIMFLHCLKYKGPDWDFQTDLPNWASADWNESS